MALNRGKSLNAQPVISWPKFVRNLATNLALNALVLAVFSSDRALAQTTEINPNQSVILECMRDESNTISLRDRCFGIVAQMCDERPLNATVGTVTCWVEEYFVWHGLMRSRYEHLVSEADAEVLEHVQRSQRNWETQAEMDCYLVASSNPQTYKTLLPACRAEAAMRRYVFLGELLGADWVPLP